MGAAASGRRNRGAAGGGGFLDDGQKTAAVALESVRPSVGCAAAASATEGPSNESGPRTIDVVPARSAAGGDVVNLRRRGRARVYWRVRTVQGVVASVQSGRGKIRRAEIKIVSGLSVIDSPRNGRFSFNPPVF